MIRFYINALTNPRRKVTGGQILACAAQCKNITDRQMASLKVIAAVMARSAP